MQRLNQRARFACLLMVPMLAGLAALEAQDHVKKTPIPDKAAQAKSEALINDIFKDDLDKAKESDALLKLAGYLLAQGKDSKDHAANRYVLFRMARDLAARGGDAPLALAVIEELARDFDVQPMELKAAALEIAVGATGSKETSKAQVDLILPLITDALEADNYETAIHLGKIAEAAARKSKVLQLVTQVQKRNEEVLAVQKGFARLQGFVERLKKNPKDAEANLELGKYYALLKGRWEKALPLLALGGDPALKAQAEQDLARPKDAKGQLAVADGWWDLAAKEKDPVQVHLQRRAAHWYDQAITNLSGLNRTKAQKRLDLVAAQVSGAPVNGAAGPVGELKKMEGHTDEVKGVAFSPDGRHAVSGSVDQTVRTWDLTTGKEDKVLRGHSKQVWSVGFHPNGRQVFSASWDATARLWDAKAGTEVRRFPHRIDVNGLAVSRDGNSLLTGSDDQNSYLWNVSTGDEIRRFPGHTGFVYGVALAPDGRHCASGSVDKTVRIYELATGQLVRTLEGHTNAVTSVVFAPDSRHVFTCGDGYAHQWDLTSGKEVRRYEGHTGLVLGLALSHDGRRLLTGGDDKTIRLWDVNTGKELYRGAGHTDTVNSVAFSADGRRALSGGLDRTVRLWGLPAR